MILQAPDRSRHPVRNIAIVTALLLTGGRASAIAALQWHDVDVERREVRFAAVSTS